MSRPRPAAEIARAIARLSAEPQVPIADLADKPLTINGVVVRPPGVALLRWGRTGKAGCYLDVLFDPARAGWVTSRPALARFARDLAAGVRLVREPAGGG